MKHRVFLAMLVCAIAGGLMACAQQSTPSKASTEVTMTAGSITSESPPPATQPTSTTSVPSSAPAPSAKKGQGGQSQQVHHPGFGSGERKAILDGLRPTIQRDLAQKVIFEVARLAVTGTWAFAEVVPRTPAGGKIDYMNTRHRDWMREGVLDGGNDAHVYALLRHANGEWRVVTFVVGPTDVAWEGWPRKFGAPQAIFP